MRIPSKAAYFRLAEQGLLGNTLRQWRTIQDALTSDVQTFGVRQIGKAGGGAHYILPRHDLAAIGDIGTGWMIDEAAPDARVILQGEVCRTTRGWEGLLGLRTGLPMRPAMYAGLIRPLRGVAVKFLLDTYLDPNSRDDLDALLDLYPDAAVELASYPFNLGRLPRRNTIIWEVRNY